MVKVPLILVGGIRSIDFVEAFLKKGDADYVAISRPFIREPGLINRWESGDRRPAKCISCSMCFKSGLDGGVVECKQGREF